MVNPFKMLNEMGVMCCVFTKAKRECRNLERLYISPCVGWKMVPLNAFGYVSLFEFE